MQQETSTIARRRSTRIKGKNDRLVFCNHMLLSSLCRNFPSIIHVQQPTKDQRAFFPWLSDDDVCRVFWIPPTDFLERSYLLLFNRKWKKFSSWIKCISPRLGKTQAGNYRENNSELKKCNCALDLNAYCSVVQFGRPLFKIPTDAPRSEEPRKKTAPA